MSEVLATLLRVNLALALSVGLTLVLRAPVRRAFGARVAYALWALPLAASLAALAPRPAAQTLPFVAEATEAVARAIPRATAGGAAAELWIGLWLAGAAAAIAWTALRQAQFVRGLGRLQPAPGGVWRAARPDAGPAVVGALRPRIVTPSDFEQRFDPAEREVILAHERAHLRGGDALVNAALAAVQALCWFNPAAHLAARALRVDQELACDAAVLARFPKARRLYGELLLKTQIGSQPLPLGCHWPPASQHPLKERIAMLKSPLPARSRRRLGLAAVASLAAACAGAAWAAGGKPAEVGAPQWVERPTGADIADVYPPQAAAQNLGGLALITCRVNGEGRLERCALLKEDPAGAGFGEAALRLSDRFRMTTTASDGASTAGAEVRIPIRFLIPG
ncbi:TonB family protein [Phenylobacterium sp.]|uniref:TonB family protein n=1 Tax=Phenylobacterium sp. TaxID=1871053 RepID=UPI0035B4DDB2